MADNDSDDELPAAEQHAFSDAHKLIRQLVEVEGMAPVHVGTGVLIAALSCLRKALPTTDVAALLYEYADDYAARHLEP